MHPEFRVSSAALVETAAEKWVAVTRRVATSQHREYYHDPQLVRHLYDLYKINTSTQLPDTFYALAARIVFDDRKRYKNHNHAYYENPVSEIERAVEALSCTKEWKNNWDVFIDTMVFSKEKPTYSQVIKSLQANTYRILTTLRSVN